MKTKKILFTTISISSFLLLAACGNGSNNDTAEGNEGKGITLELFSNKGENIDTLESIITKFEAENPGVTIELQSPPEAETVLKTRLTKNDVPDIMSIGGNATFGELARAGVLADLSDTNLLETVQPAYLGMSNKLVGTEVEGDFGIPYATNANGVLINQDKLDELGLAIPKTYAEFIAALEIAKEKGEVPILFTLKDAWTALPIWNGLGGNLAPENFAELRTAGDASFVEDYAEVATKIAELVKYGEGDIFGLGYDDGNKQFANGEGLFYIQGNWAIPEILKNNPDANINFMALPSSDDQAQNKLVSGIDVMLAVSEESEHKADAMKFVEFMISEEVSNQYIDEQKAFSAIQGVLQEDPTFANIKVFFEEGNIDSFPDHFYPAGIGAENIIQGYLIDGDKDVFLKSMDSEWDKVVNR
jgi:raffinose/stachyose/melibiose transport system substrate-binding protein